MVAHIYNINRYNNSNKYYEMNFIFDDSIRNTDTLWKYVDDETYNNLVNQLRNKNNLEEYFNKRIRWAYYDCSNSRRNSFCWR